MSDTRMTRSAGTKPPRLLLLEDSALDAELIQGHLEQLDIQPEITRATGRNSFTDALASGQFDIILSDYSLPDFDGMAALDMAVIEAPEVPFIFVSGVLGEEVAIEAFRRGATDYVLKQRLIRLVPAVERALAEAREKAERRRVEQHKELLVRELSHRVKNTMAMVMSIVRRSSKGSVSVKDYEEKLLSRIRAMADSHSLLFESNWSETDLHDVLTRSVYPYDESMSRFSVSAVGSVGLSPKKALALGMIFNELVTNATKYGALSSDTGRISVDWTITQDSDGPMLVHITWREQNGPAVREPETEGFGSSLLKRSVEYELEGKVSLTFAASGFACDLTFPMDAPRSGEH